MKKIDIHPILDVPVAEKATFTLTENKLPARKDLQLLQLFIRQDILYTRTA